MIDTSEVRDSSYWLAEAKRVYAASYGRYSDAVVACGKMLHEYVIAYLAEVERSPVGRRLATGCNRAKALTIASAELGVKRNRLHDLIAIHQVIELLGGGDRGRLCAFACLSFRPFITRTTAAGVHGKTRSDSEKWVLDPTVGSAGKAMFRRAVDSAMSIVQVEEMIREWGRRTTKANPKAASRPREQSTAKPNSRGDKVTVARVAASGDVVELILEMVRESRDPWAVAQKLIPELEKVPRKKHPILG